MKLTVLSQSLLFLVLLVFVRCKTPDDDAAIQRKEHYKFSHNVLENGRIVSKPVAQPMPVDQVLTSHIQYDDNNKNDRNYVAHGDILIPLDELEHSGSKRIKRKIIAESTRFGTSNRWPRAVIPYEFISGIDNRVQRNVLNAIQHWHQRTCIRFEPYDAERHWDINAKITIEDTGSGCATFVGYRPSSNGLLSSYSVYLPLQCPLGSAIHELGHVIGFYHEMARTDRDQEIVLYFNLMSSSEATQYDIMPNPMPGYYSQPYDLSSIMHYFPTDVMAARDDRRTFLMGQRVALSFLDGKLANLGYHCGDKCDSSLQCLNEGYVDQFCQCTCPDGFLGERCNLLQGSIETNRFLPITPETSTSAIVEKPQTTSIATTTTTTTKTPTTSVLRWLEWNEWSNCSESCGSGVRVRTRLCSSTTIEGSANPCSSLGGGSFEIESCQNPECNQADIILSCTFDLADEVCPLQNTTNSKIQSGAQADQARPISDHTRGDGKYLLFIGKTNQSDNIQTFQLGPFTPSKSANENKHCLQFWYSIFGQAVGKFIIVTNKTNNDTFTFAEKDEGVNWQQEQRTISNDEEYKLIFEYVSMTSEYNYIALDDISIIDGVCLESKKSENQRRRKRRQANRGCSRIVELTTSNTVESITTPNYPSLYPANSECYYYIRAPKSYRIIFQFTDFNIPNSNRNNCDDTVEIRYYHLGQSGPRYCGTGANSNNLQFVSTGNYLMIVFRSDQNFAGRGFRAQATLAM